MLRFAKRLLFGTGPAPRKIWFGMGAGSRLVIDPASKSQRIVGLDEAEIAGAFRRAVQVSRTFIDVGASDGYYPILALRLNPNLTAIGCDGTAAFDGIARENYKLNFPAGGPVLEWVTTLVGGGDGQISLDKLGDGRPGPVLVKIDVDGAEVDVLQSGSRVLARPDCRVLLETHSAELEADSIKLLESHGFTCTLIKNAWWRAIVPERRLIEVNRWVFAEKPAPVGR